MKRPAATFAFANERTEEGFLRNLTVEMKFILQAMDPVVREENLHVQLIPAATSEEIRAVFQDKWLAGRVNIFHYGGHATPDRLWLESSSGGNEAFFSEGLARFLGVQQGLQLVFLNACATADQAKRMLQENIPAVIATSQKVPDDIATQFARIFYLGMASGSSIEEAFREAEGYLLGRKGTEAFLSSNTRSLFWDEEIGFGELDLPWRLFLKQEASWYPAQWRLLRRELPSSTSSQVPTKPSLEGAVIQKHLIHQTLGHSEIGTVYRALHMEQQQDRALWISYEIMAGFKELYANLKSGYNALSRIKHPALARVKEIEMIDGNEFPQIYFSVELLKGKRLDEVEMKGDANKVIILGMDLCEVLHEAHEIDYTDTEWKAQKGVVHGNLMTNKIFLDNYGNARIIEFLFTNLTRLPEVKLRLPLEAENHLRNLRLKEYFAPELLAGDANVSVLTDVYSVGAVLLEMYTGKTIDQWSFSSEKDLADQVISELGSVSLPLLKVIYRATLPNPDERWQSADEMRDFLAPSLSWWRKFWRRRNLKKAN